MSNGVSADLAGIIPLLEEDLRQNVPANMSPAGRALRAYLEREDGFQMRYNENRNPRFAELPIDTSQAIGSVSDQWLRNHNSGSRDEHRNIGLLRNIVRIPLDRPASPGPTHPIYFVPWNVRDEDIDIPHRLSRLPEHHPEYVDRGVLQREPFANHPCESGSSQLATIPYWRIWDSGDMLPSEMACETDRQFFGFCGKPTRSACEDTSHFRPVPICDDCETLSHREFREIFRRIDLDLRQYLCHKCLNGDTILGQLAGKGHRVWYANPTNPIPDFSAQSIAFTGGDGRVGGYMGPPLEITGERQARLPIGHPIEPQAVQAQAESLWNRVVSLHDNQATDEDAMDVDEGEG
ncbi:hypothetical protein F4818DRAFT_435925 [Hypoxylon cercidicola]|nr:hypothetical protein F4818DRAFT_435925 [Hypoxylon cercidicola]